MYILVNSSAQYIHILDIYFQFFLYNFIFCEYMAITCPQVCLWRYVNNV
jgi:hypothetical protein